MSYKGPYDRGNKSEAEYLDRANHTGNVAGDLTVVGNLIADGINLNAVLVSELPAAATSTGARYMVSDSTVAASGNFGAVVAGAGINVVPVFSDGTNWVIG
jgi:hypothetical protein